MEPVTTTALHALALRRAELRESIGALEASLAAPASGRPVVWGERVHTALVTVAGDFREHIAVTEGDGGLHQAILAGDLRLANAVDALTSEHHLIGAELAALVEDTEPPVTAEDAPQVRERATRLLGIVVGHRQRGADLIYEAYQTDIGGGD